MIDLARDGYTHEEVKAVLHSAEGSRTLRFKYHLLDVKDNFISELKTVERGGIEFSALSDIKRTAQFTLSEESYRQETYSTWSDIDEMKWSDL